MGDTEFDGLPFSTYMLAGATAGMTEHIAMFPVDTVKTRMQALAHPGQGLHGVPLHLAVRSIIRREGFWSLYRGVAAAALGAGPAHAVYFSTYETAKSLLRTDPERPVGPLKAAAAGSIATVASDAVMVPTDVIKQRLQHSASPYRGVLDCFRTVLRQEGVLAFYKSYPITLVMNVPYTTVHFATYETLKAVMSSGEDEGLLVQVVAGGAAGALSGACTTPLDVVKTRLQTDSMLAHRRRTSSLAMVSLMKRIVREEGYGVLWSGLSARVWFHAPSAAVCWGVYESMKSLLSS